MMAKSTEESNDPARSRLHRWSVTAAKRVGPIVLLVIVLRLTGCVERLFYQPISEATPPPVGVEGVWFDSGNGERLYGWWIPAKRHVDAQGAAPTVLHIHGNAGNVIYHEEFSACFAAGGFNVFLFDYKGFGQSEGSGKNRRSLIEDTHAALDYVRSRDDVDSNRVAIYGHSLGGAIGINVMSERKEIRAAVFESPFASWRDVAANAVGGMPGRMLAWALISDAARPLDAIATIDRPILIVHGEIDSIVPAAHGRRLAEAAPNATFREYEGGDHNTLQDTHPEVKRLMVEFLRQHLE